MCYMLRNWYCVPRCCGTMLKQEQVLTLIQSFTLFKKNQYDSQFKEIFNNRYCYTLVIIAVVLCQQTHQWWSSSPLQEMGWGNNNPQTQSSISSTRCFFYVDLLTLLSTLQVLVYVADTKYPCKLNWAYLLFNKTLKIPVI